MGWVIDSVELVTSQKDSELWNFSEFLEPIFDKISAKQGSRENTDEEAKDE